MTALPRLIIRADATSGIGIGHVMRCLSLAAEWQGQGGEAVYVSRLETKALQRLLGDRNLDVIAPGKGDMGLEAVLAATTPGDWVLLDGYGFGPDLSAELRRSGRRVAVVSDTLDQAPAHREADVVVNTGHEAEYLDYDFAVGAVGLMGVRYALLRPEFSVVGAGRLPATGSARRLLLGFGGADSARMTERALRIAATIPGPLTAKVVVGQANPRFADIERLFHSLGLDGEVLAGCDDFSALMGWADLGFAAGGVTALEMAATGLPLLLVPTASNQLPNVRGLVAHGAALSPGGAGADDGEIAAALQTLVRDREARQRMSEAGRAFVDGHGASRVAGVLADLSGAVECGFRLRRAVAADMMQFYRLANDPLVRENAFTPERIPLSGHRDWFFRRIESPLCAMYVLDCCGVVAAQARYDAEGDRALVDFSVHPAFRGRSLGGRILTESCQRALKRLQVRRLRGEVFSSNDASSRCFLKAGFREAGPEILRGRNCRIFEYGD